jgi:hypothetical protein
MRLSDRWSRLAWFIALYAASVGVFTAIIYGLQRLLAP